MEPRIDFVIAGVQKAATTALSFFLQQHPDVEIPLQKELHFFSDDSLSWAAPDYSSYHAAFMTWGQPKVRGEATPIYIYWPDAIARLQRYNPAIRIIVILRDPVWRAYSQWAMERARDWDQMAFADAIRGGRQRVADAPGGVHRVFSYVERGFYAPQLRRVFQIVGRDQVLVLTNENLRDHQAATLDRLCEFLKLPRYGTYPRDEEIRPAVPVAPVPPMDAEDERYLRALFRDDVQDVQSLTGLDLTAWL